MCLSYFASMRSSRDSIIRKDDGIFRYSCFPDDYNLLNLLIGYLPTYSDLSHVDSRSYRMKLAKF